MNPTVVPTRLLRQGVALFLLAALCYASAISGQPSKDSWFSEVSAEWGVSFAHSSGLQGQYLLPEIMGSGVALFDYDNDGLLDIFVVNSGHPGNSDSGSRLFRQTKPGRFVDRTQESGIVHTEYGMGVSTGDIDNDGFLDLFITNLGPDRLYANNTDGTFTDVTEESGIEGIGWSTSATFCDFDRDGLLDLYVATYVDVSTPRACSTGSGEIDYCGPDSFPGLPDLLYRNSGNRTFAPIRFSADTDRANRALGVACVDVNSDSYPDILVANDGEENDLWVNDGEHGFTNRAMEWGVSVNLFGETEASMGIAIGDVNADQSFDILVTHLGGETNTLYSHSSRGFFTDVTTTSGAIRGMPYTGFGTAMFDVDHDRDLDVIVANGRVRKGDPSSVDADKKTSQEMTASWFNSIYGEPNFLILNDGVGNFTEVPISTSARAADIGVSRGLAHGDIDNDGDVDFVVTNSNGPLRIYRNDAPKQGSWLKVRVVDPALKRDAIGAVVRIRVGEETLIRKVHYPTSYLSSSDASIHFGTGPVSLVDDLSVDWPDGSTESFGSLATDQAHVIRKGQGASTP